MSSLNYSEVLLLESFFERREVAWCGTHRQLGYLFRQAGIPETEGWSQEMWAELGSKRNRWRWIFEQCSNEVTCDVISSAIDGWERGASEEAKAENKANIERCKKIAKTLVLSDEEWDELTAQEPHFNNQKELLIEDLKQAKLGVWICMYFFNDYDIAKTLVEKANEGVSINLIIQDNEKNKRQYFWNDLEEISSVLWWYPDAKGINHHKFCIIDTRSVWQGSFNFTKAAATRNRECLSRDTNREVIDKFAEEFKDIKRYLVKEQKLRQDVF